MLSHFKFSIFLITGTIIACTPKVTVPVVEESTTPTIEVPKVDNNPCTTLDELAYSERDGVETAYVLYKDQIKQNNYKEAFDLWQKAYYGAPAANGSIKYQFEDGIKIYKHFYESETDSIQKQVYVDSIMAIYDKRIECYGEPAYVAGRKAFDRYYYYSAHSDEQETYDLFKEAIDGKGKEVDYFVVNPFTKMLSDRIINEKVDHQEGRKYAMLLWDAIKYGTERGKNEEAWNIINAYAPSRLENLEGLQGFYLCDYYSKRYLPLLQEETQDCELINKVYRRLLWGGCEKTSPEVQEVAQLKAQKCYTPPPPDGPLKKAYTAYTEGQYNEAVRLFDEFIEGTSDVAKKFKYTMLVAKIYYGDIRNFPKSRSYALKAASYNPSSGEPYLLIGKLYASSGPLCGPGTGWDSQVVCWPAIDQFKKAKSDPATAAEAQKFINTYSKYMPGKEDIFIRGIKAGSPYRVECWIRENTTVRTAD